MRYPPSTPTQFSNAKQFVETRGNQVWYELTDEVMPDEWFRPCDIAHKLPSIQKYKNPERYLRAVLKAILTDFKENPSAYGKRAPITTRSSTGRLGLIKI